jgi:pimeloyl-ACP methyl ester carboxylesterase
VATHWLSISAPNHAIDIFYLYPTAWANANPNPQICEIDEPSMRIGAPMDFERQATAFQTVGNVFAPYYRQDNYSSVRRLEVIAGIPTMDATAAFDYFIDHFNNNRPFILVGHSQGATILGNLLADYLRHRPDVYSRMIAAYVIGSPITADYLARNHHLKFAEGPDDTGVIISYNTEAPTIGGTNPVLYGQIGIVINPLTWTRDETLAPNTDNLGSIQLLATGAVAKGPDGTFLLMTPSADAQVDKAKGVLICSTVSADVYSPGPPKAAGPKGVFHNFDIPFYYYNLRANAANRAKHYLAAHPGTP